MRVFIDPPLCQGRGRCHEGGQVPTGRGTDVRLAAANCPESAIAVPEEN